MNGQQRDALRNGAQHGAGGLVVQLLIAPGLFCPRIASVRNSDLLCSVLEKHDYFQTEQSKKYREISPTKLATICSVPEGGFRRKGQPKAGSSYPLPASSVIFLCTTAGCFQITDSIVDMM